MRFLRGGAVWGPGRTSGCRPRRGILTPVTPSQVLVEGVADPRRGAHIAVDNIRILGTLEDTDCKGQRNPPTLLYSTMLYSTLICSVVSHSTLLCIGFNSNLLFYTIIYWTLIYYPLLYCAVWFSTLPVRRYRGLCSAL